MEVRATRTAVVDRVPLGEPHKEVADNRPGEGMAAVGVEDILAVEVNTAHPPWKFLNLRPGGGAPYPPYGGCW